MNWLEKKVTIYKDHYDIKGRDGTFEEVIFWGFEKDLPHILALRKLNAAAPNYKNEKDKLKKYLQGYTPAALLASREKDNVIEINRTGLVQLDFDYDDIKDYDIEELKLAVFNLPFVAFCGLSCTGNGFYALVQIAEPYSLKEYAQHCFTVFEQEYGIIIDKSKGVNPQDLRYLSYDCNMLLREDPKRLHIKRFHNVQANDKPGKIIYTTNDSLLNNELQKLSSVQNGQRFTTVQKAAYTLGGTLNNNYLQEIKQAINSNPSFNGEEKEFNRCAEQCFEAGKQKPLLKK